MSMEVILHVTISTCPICKLRLRSISEKMSFCLQLMAVLVRNWWNVDHFLLFLPPLTLELVKTKQIISLRTCT